MNFGKLKVNFSNYDSDLSRKRQALLMMTKVAEAAERYEDMCKFLRLLIELDPSLNREERYMMALGFKNVVVRLRMAWRTLLQENNNKFQDVLQDYQVTLENDIRAVCENVLDLLENNLMEYSEHSAEAKVFYYKLMGDYYRYLSEIDLYRGMETNCRNKSQQAYIDGINMGRGSLEATDTTMLGISLNYAVFCYEILSDKDKALEVAKFAFDEAITKLDDLEEDSYKDSTLIMQLLRDNLTLWTVADSDE